MELRKIDLNMFRPIRYEQKEMSRFTLIEETALLQKDTPNDDFAAHFYMKRYDRLKGIPMATPDQVITAATKAIGDSIHKNQYELAQICAKDRGDAMAWSMNWYRLRTPDNKTYQLSDDDKVKIISNAQALTKPSPLLTQTFIFQQEDSDMLLVAVSLTIDPEHLCLD